ncbi:hypothetical protein NDU88_011560 [Pleurodeles waltl]|uniref:Uncharacterized protein n=1 Tax=Pleurodeles waltl TaxID=8319 RepID=A0AAV7QZG3_PLEWA|nr:hypothetical protein NDU88_011560 [Pleurodeles waltl]
MQREKSVTEREPLAPPHNVRFKETKLTRCFRGTARMTGGEHGAQGAPSPRDNRIIRSSCQVATKSEAGDSISGGTDKIDHISASRHAAFAASTHLLYPSRTTLQ